MIGNDEGVAENTRELGVRHIPEVRCNTHGTPLISSMLEQARAHSDSPYLAIINTDIILFPDILKAVRAAANAFERFVMIGQRWDMDVTSELEAGGAGFRAV